MEIRKTYCPDCQHEVEITLSPAPLHGGQATLPEGGEMVCLDYGPGCGSERCPASGAPRIVMGVRLAKSGLRHEDMEHIYAVCDGCGEVGELDVIDETHAYCNRCGTVNLWSLIRLDGEEWVAVTGEKAKSELA